MYVAIQTISWGREPDVGRMIQEIKEIGYQGVEFAQHPDVLGPPEELHKLLAAPLTPGGPGLEFVGLSGGSLDEKIRYKDRYVSVRRLAELHKNRVATTATKGKPADPYIYIDEWDPRRSPAAMSRNALALHPHMFKAFQTAREAEELLHRYPDLWFLPDTAHLTVAGENVIDVLDTNYDRIIAVHLKDWSAEYGRAYHFYSRGFVELGQGDVKPDEIVQFLLDRHYRDWLVIEQDTTDQPAVSARQSRDWLRDTCGI